MMFFSLLIMVIASYQGGRLKEFDIHGIMFTVSKPLCVIYK